jgi:hypothetical protein
MARRSPSSIEAWLGCPAVAGNCSVGIIRAVVSRNSLAVGIRSPNMVMFRYRSLGRAFEEILRRCPYPLRVDVKNPYINFVSCGGFRIQCADQLFYLPPLPPWLWYSHQSCLRLSRVAIHPLAAAAAGPIPRHRLPRPRPIPRGPWNGRQRSLLARNRPAAPRVLACRRKHSRSVPSWARWLVVC